MLFEFKFCLFHENQSFIYLFFSLRQFYYFINRSSDTNIFTTNEAMYCDLCKYKWFSSESCESSINPIIILHLNICKKIVKILCY